MIFPARDLRDGNDVRLERDVLGGGAAVRVLEDDVGLAEPLLDIALALSEQVDDVGFRGRARLDIRATGQNAVQAFVHERRVRGQGFLRIENRRQLLVLHLNQR